jgi:hypothetical protein
MRKCVGDSTVNGIEKYSTKQGKVRYTSTTHLSSQGLPEPSSDQVTHGMR